MRYRHILQIDDDDEDQEIFETALADVTSEVQYTGSSSAIDALLQLQSGVLRPDIIFLDLNMPLMTGMDFLREVRMHDHLRQIPVVIFSTSSQPAAVTATQDLGAADFMTKPTTYRELVQALRTMLSEA